MSDKHADNCAIYHNAIDDCDCYPGRIRALQAKLAVAVEALEEMRCSCYPYHKNHDSEDCSAVIAKEALAKIRS